MDKKAERRRGETLENAILNAAWEELAANGYNNLTMEAVATRAQTSRPVLNRRWSDRAELAVAAIRHMLAQHPLSAPDLGSLREEMITLMRQSLDRGMSTGLLAMLQIGDYFHETGTSPRDFRQNIVPGELETLNTIIQRGIARGEIDAKKLTPRIITLVPDLLRHEMLMTRGHIPDRVISEVVDDIFLPLVR